MKARCLFPSPQETAVLMEIRGNTKVIVSDLARHFERHQATIQTYLTRLEHKGLVLRVGTKEVSSHNFATLWACSPLGGRIADLAITLGEIHDDRTTQASAS
jgi:membrane carboxypeptidase/penicillin-binding protein PbpC